MWIEYNRFALSDGGRYALNVKNDGALIATKTKNCRCASGTLRTGVGAQHVKNLQGKTFRIPVGASSVVTFRGEITQDGTDIECAYISQDGYVYIYSKADATFKKIDSTIKGFKELVKDSCDAFGEKFFAICKNGFCLCNRTGKIYERVVVNNGTGCFFQNRFFYARDNYVCYSDIDAYTALNETLYGAGKIAFGGDGPVERLMTFNDRVLVFMSDGVWEFHAKGADDEFFVKRIGYYGDRIVGATVARCGNTVMFVNRVGELYRLQGDSFQKIAENIPQNFYELGAQGGGNGELYFISGVDRKVFVSDVNGECYFTAYEFSALSACDGQVFGVYLGFLAEIHEKYVLSYENTCQFIVNNWLEKDNRERQIEKLRLYGTGEAMAIVRNENQTAFKTVPLQDGGVEVPIGIRGKRFSLEFKLSEKSKIWRVEALAKDVGGGK